LSGSFRLSAGTLLSFRWEVGFLSSPRCCYLSVTLLSRYVVNGLTDLFSLSSFVCLFRVGFVCVVRPFFISFLLVQVPGPTVRCLFAFCCFFEPVSFPPFTCALFSPSLYSAALCPVFVTLFLFVRFIGRVSPNHYCGALVWAFCVVFLTWERAPFRDVGF